MMISAPDTCDFGIFFVISSKIGINASLDVNLNQLQINYRSRRDYMLDLVTISARTRQKLLKSFIAFGPFFRHTEKGMLQFFP